MKLKRVTFITISAIALLFLWPSFADAQCAMCKAVLEDEYVTSGNRKSEGINGGILFLMGIPYLLIGISLVYFFKFRSKN